MSKKELSVAMIEPVGGHGGMNYYDFGLCGGLARSKVDVTLYTCDETVVLPDNKLDVQLKFERIYGKDSKWLRAIRYFFGLMKTFSHAKKVKKRIAHFHIFQITSLEWLTIKLCKWLGFRIVITAHDVESFADNNRAKLVLGTYQISDVIIAHNQVSKQELINNLGLEDKKIITIPHGNYIDTIRKRQTKEEARADIGVQHTGPILLFFGQIKKVKALEVLLHALADVKKSFPDVKLIIAGKLWNNDFSQYEEIIRSHQLEDNIITHIRYIPDELVDSYFQAADIVVLPYRKIYQSGVLLQSMSYKRPVVVSNIQGMTEIVKDNENGYVFETGNKSSLSSRLLRLLEDEAERERISTNGLETVLKKHSWEEIGRQTARVYEAVLTS